MLQGLSRPRRIVSLMSYPGAAAAVASPTRRGRDPRGVRARRRRQGAHAAALSASGLTPSEWIELVDRLGEIPDPTVASGHSSAAIPDGRQRESGASAEGGTGGDD